MIFIIIINELFNYDIGTTNLFITENYELVTKN